MAEKLKTESKTNSELTTALNKRDEKLKKKEKLLNEQTQSQNAMEKELGTLKVEVSAQQTLIKRLETALVSQLFVYFYGCNHDGVNGRRGIVSHGLWEEKPLLAFHGNHS